jgi:ribosomal protein S18 acetylase RimI-like enzyme
MRVRIITADPSHAAAISMIGKQSFGHAFGHLFKSKDELIEYLNYAYKPEKIAAGIKKSNNVFFLAFIEGVPVGFAKVKKYSLNDQFESVAQMELQKIYVLPYYHGSGAGAALMQEVIELANELRPDLIWLDTYIGNAKAIRFYQKHGFKKSGKHYFTIGTQTFEYDLMSLPVTVAENANCRSDAA